MDSRRPTRLEVRRRSRPRCRSRSASGTRRPTRATTCALQDLRLYDRALTAADVEQLAKSPRTAATCSRKPADKRTPAGDGRALHLVADDRTTTPYQRDSTRHWQAASKEEAGIKGRGTIAHVMQREAGDAGGVSS